MIVRLSHPVLEWEIGCFFTCLLQSPTRLTSLPSRFKVPIWLYNNGAELQPVDHPRASPIRVAMNWLQLCPTELAGMPKATSPNVEVTTVSPNNGQQAENFPDQPKEPDRSKELPKNTCTCTCSTSGVWANHPRPRKRPVGNNKTKDREM